MTQTIIDLTEDLDLKLKYYKLKNNINSKSDAILDILEKYLPKEINL